jgi:CheY-like chemotaxis protein
MPQAKALTILVAEDDSDDRDLTRDAFAASKVTHALQFVANGEDLLEQIESGELPALILLDLKMPRMDGHQTLTALKSDVRLRHIPVVMLTTSHADADVARSYELGASSFITKPSTFEEFIVAVDTFGKYWLDLVQLPLGAS